MTRTSLISTLIPLAMLAAASCSKQEDASKQTKPPTPVKVAAIDRHDLDKQAEVIGTLYGDEEIVISSKVNGRVASIKADLGDRVGGAAVLAQIDPVDYELAVAQRKNALSEALAKLGLTEIPSKEFDIETVATVKRAQSQSANAQAKVDRARKLFDQTPPLISEQEFEDLRTAQEVSNRDYEVARLDVKSQLAMAQSRQSDLAAAEEQLRDTTIIAPPVDGSRKYGIASRSVSIGEYMREGTAMFRLVLDDKIKFRGSLPERYFAEVAIGQKVRIYQTGSDGVIEGKVSHISPTVDLATRTFQVEAIFDNPKQLLRPGAFVRGEVVTGVYQNVPEVPKTAVLSFAGVDKVFTIKDGKAVEHIVTLGRDLGDRVAIINGLKDEKEVIVSGLSRLANQAPVELEASAQPASTPAQ